MKDELVMMVVKCCLTEEEKLEMGIKLAGHVRSIEQLTEEKKDHAATYKTKIDSHSLEANSLSIALQSGYEMREVECSMEKDYTRKTIDFVRVDTGELVQSRPMEIGEAQECMFDTDERHKGNITLLGR